MLTIPNITMDFYIFRHGATHQTRNGLLYGDKVVTAKILPEGKPTIVKLAKYLKSVNTDYNVASEFKRVQQTVEIVSKVTGKKFMTDTRINELMEPPPSINASDYPYTETLDDMTKRVKDFLKDLDKRKIESVLVATHGGIIAAIKHLVVNGKFERDSLPDFPPPGVLTVIKGKKVEEIDFN